MERRRLTVFAVGVALLIGLLAVFATSDSVPLAAEEPEFPPPVEEPEFSPPPVEETELSPPSAAEEEFSSLLEWILSHPEGQELIDGLSQDTIDQMAVDPMPPPQEPQPVVYGGAGAVKLTDEEAKKVAERFPPREKPADFCEGYVIITTPEVGRICTGIRDLGEIDKMDAAVVEDVRNYLSKFDLSADLDGDGYISRAECVAWVESYFEERGLL